MELKLTDRTIKALKLPARGKRLEVVDSAQPALRLRVTPAGARTWSISMRVAGRRRRFTIGSYPAISLADARARAGKLLAEVRDGRDPVEEARADREAALSPHATTLDEALSLYAAAVLPGLRTGADIERDIRRDLADLLQVRVGTITSAQLARVIDNKVSVAPVGANRLLAALKPLWRWLAARGHVESDVARAIEKPTTERARSRDRVLSTDEISAIWQATKRMPYPWGPFYRLVLLSAQRISEVAGMSWSEIEFSREIWTIPGDRSKNGKANIVHLSGPAMETLREMENRGKLMPLVFTTTGITPISGFSKAKRRLDELSGVSGWWVHDFRRTFATCAADMGINATVADRVLNHVAAGSMSTVLRVYQRSEMLDQRRHALDTWAAYILSAAGEGDAAANVVPLAAEAGMR
jgi:integrase